MPLRIEKCERPSPDPGWRYFPVPLWTSYMDGVNRLAKNPTRNSWGLCEQVQGVLPGEMKNLNAEEGQKVEELITEI
jgi:hypothetical protein